MKKKTEAFDQTKGKPEELNEQKDLEFEKIDEV